MARFTPEEKLAIIKEVKDSGQSVFSVCRKHKISKVTFYTWLSRYKANRKNREISLQDRIRKGNSHPRSLTFSQKLKILSLVHKDPKLSSKKLAEIAGLGNHGVQNLLYKEGLNRLESRLEFSQKPFWKREGSDRREAMIKLQYRGWKINDICKQFKISKPTFVKWRKRYEQGGMLDDRFVRGEKHHKFLGQERERQILDFVTKNPAMSVHKISGHFSGFVGHHGIQNILARHHLGTYEQRLAFSRLSEKSWRPNIHLSNLPYIPLRIWRMLFAPFATIPKLGWLFTRGQIFLLFIFFLSFYFYKLVAAIVTSPTGNSVGTFFASISLTFGLFFFIYSMKYYISTLMVLKLAQSGSLGSGVSENSIVGKVTAFLGKFGFRMPATNRRVNPLTINLDRVKLDSGERPFVSIHAAIYNEKRVVERLIRACEAQEWYSGDRQSEMVHREGQIPMNDSRSTINDAPANYEVIIADDSKDETTEIAKQLLASEGRILDRILFNEEMEIYVSSPPVGSSLPVIKLIHRFSRSGFKGGALQKALENTNPKAAYVTIFDADFVPYPDTITQFVKTFQVLNGDRQSEMVHGGGQNPMNDERSTINDSRIAAVQGYQWHVLNKGANWVTRGVRTEYAGSYVIERASEEIYGGLKQIAGSVFCIRTDVLRKFGWGTSITEDFELTLKLYEAGYKVAFTPYIQGPAEAVSTIKTLIRQRMRWAEGASFNIKVMLPRMLWGRWEAPPSVIASETKQSPNSHSELGSESGSRNEFGMTEEIATSFDEPRTRKDNEGKVWVPSRLTRTEKLEFAYLAPYYLQAAFFIIGTFSWFLSEAVFGSRLPFWTVAFGWSLVFTNLLALPLMNIVGMFLEESDERDYIGILSFIALSYIVVPFQAYAAIKGFLETEEGPWFRTPKTGLITDTFGRSEFGKFFGNVFGRPAPVMHSGALFTPGAGQGAALLASLRLRSGHTPGVLPALLRTFGVRPRHMRYAGNLALGFVMAITVLMSLFAPLIPQVRLDVKAEDRKFAKLSHSEIQRREVTEVIQETDGEIKEPKFLRYKAKDEKYLEYIFHPEPRVRTKYDGREIEMEVVGSDGLGKAQAKKSFKENGVYVYKDIFEGVDLRLFSNGDEMKEEFLLRSYKDFVSINYNLKTVDLEVVAQDDEIFFYGNDKEKWLFAFQTPYMYEEGKPDERNGGLTYQLEKTVFGYQLKKVLTEEGKRWLSDPVRQFPVIIDPTAVNSVIQAAISAAESDYGSPTRTMSYFPNATGGAAWYVVDADAGAIVVEKCAASSNCDANGDWTQVDANLDSEADTDNLSPSIWKEGDTLYTVWFDNSRDTYQFNTLVTTSDTSGTSCNGGADIGTLATAIVSIAVADDGDVYTALSEIGGTNDAERVSRIATGACTETDITTSSGFDQNDRPEMLTIGNDAFLIFVADNGLRASVYVDDGTPGWDTSDADVNGATADNTTTDMSAVTDGTDLWIMQRNGTTGNSESFRCAACPTTSQTWTDIAEPWGSGLTATTFVGLSYLSTSNQLVAAIVDDSGSDSVLTKTTDADTISWGSVFTFGGSGVTEMDNMAMTANVANADQVAVTFQDATNSELEFSTLPENLWVMLLTMPFWPKVFGKIKKKRRRWC